VKSFVKVAPNAKKLVANNLNAALQRAGLKNVQANVVGPPSAWRARSSRSRTCRSRADHQGHRRARREPAGGRHPAHGPHQVQFVEIRRKNTDTVGIKCPLNFVGKGRASFSYDQDFSIDVPASLPFNASVDGDSDFGFGMMFNDGYGRLLAQPKLVCASGERPSSWPAASCPSP
jgi:pilus assembly protein CpaC